MEPAPERILDHAMRVLADDAGASMQEVAAAAGVGRATLYRHYASREDLLRAIRLRALAECREALARTPLDGDPAEAMRRALAALHEVIDRYRVLAGAAPVDRADPAQRGLIEQVEAPLIHLVARGQHEGAFRTHPPPAVVVRMLTGLLVAARRAVLDGLVPAPDAAGLAAAVLLHGIVT